MKKTVTLATVLLLAFTVLTACSDGAEKGSAAPASGSTVQTPEDETYGFAGQPETLSLPETETTGSEASEIAGPAEGIRANGQLPENLSDLAKEEIYYYIGVIFQAFQKLDLETLALYADSAQHVKFLQNIKEDPRSLDFWNKVVGEMVYFTDSDLLLAKCPEYLYAAWYTDEQKKGRQFPGNIIEVPYEDVMSAYDTYFSDAPYICGALDGEIEMTVQDGYIKCNLNYLLENIRGELLVDLYDYENQTLNYGALLFGTAPYSDLLNDPVEESFPEFASFMELNLDSMIELTDVWLQGQEKEGLYYNTYEKYFVPKETRAILQSYIDENCRSLREQNAVFFYFPTDIEYDYPVGYATDATKEELKKYAIMEYYKMYEYPGNSWESFSLYMTIAERLVRNGALE